MNKILKQFLVMTLGATVAQLIIRRFLDDGERKLVCSVEDAYAMGVNDGIEAAALGCVTSCDDCKSETCMYAGRGDASDILEPSREQSREDAGEAQDMVQTALDEQQAAEAVATHEEFGELPEQLKQALDAERTEDGPCNEGAK